VDAIFPKDDMPELEYSIEDGEIVEPKFFIPIIPYSLVESCEIPSNGWNCKTYARNINDIIIHVCDLISGIQS